MSSKELFFLMFICIFHTNNGCNLSTHIECNNKRCLHRIYACDGYKHCKNGEDENNCDKTSRKPYVTTFYQTYTTASNPATISKSPPLTTSKSTTSTAAQRADAKTTISPCHSTNTNTHKMVIVHDNGSTLATSTGGFVKYTLANTACDQGSIYSCRVLYSKLEYLQQKQCLFKMLNLRVNEIRLNQDDDFPVAKGSRLDIHCSLTQAPLNESGPTNNSAPLQCEGDATENCWVTGSEMRVAIQVLNCSNCEQNSCQVKGQSSCLLLVKNETSFQNAKTHCTQLGGVVAGPSVYMDQDGCILKQLIGVKYLFTSDSSQACMVYSTKEKKIRQCKDVTSLPFGCLVPSHVSFAGSKTSAASLPKEMIIIIVGGASAVVCLCVVCIMYKAVRVYLQKSHHHEDRSVYEEIALPNRNNVSYYSTIDERNYSTGCCLCVRTKPASNGKNLTRAGGPPAPHLPPRKHSSRADRKHVQLQDRMKFDAESSVNLQSSQHPLNMHQGRSKTSKRPLQKVVLASRADEADRQSFICDAEGYLQACRLHTECIRTQDGGLDEVSPCCQQYEDPYTDYITPVECEYDVHMFVT